MKFKVFLLVLALLLTSVGYLVFSRYKKSAPKQVATENIQTTEVVKTHPLQIEQMRKINYAGSDITVEQTLGSKNNYNQYVVSYQSEGSKIYALMTIPKGAKPTNGWPAIIFNHGYIPPEQYRTTEKYVAYVDAFARNGYIVFKSDYRGHGSSEGTPNGAYYSTGYTTDVLNAFASVQKHPNVDPNNIGMWGHSMGGHITLRSMVINKDIKAGVIWAGVVASYEDMATKWHRSQPWRPSPRETNTRRPSRTDLINEYGSFEQNPDFWQSISPIYWVKDLSGPIQIHHGTADAEVPWEFSESLKKALDETDIYSELHIYEGADHNISSPSFEPAISRSVAFFDQYLK